MDAAVPKRISPSLAFGGLWPLAAAFAVLAVPTAMRLKDQVWSHDFGAYGPIILAAGGWLLWRQAPELRRLAAPGRPWITALILLPSLAFYVFGRSYDFLSFESAGLYGAGVAMLHASIGPRLMSRNWFPLLYLAFAIPPPGSFLDAATAPLKHFVSWAATSGLAHLGVPVARQGVTIFVAQYQLLVEDACAGMNSIVGLVAVSLLYVYLMRGSSLAYSLVLAVLVVPIAIAANILRIVILILLTYFFGDAVGQGFLHFAAGMVLFATALLLVFAIDNLIFLAGSRLVKRS
ncbi:MAG: exosortase V [Caulobacteraceae bacterium]